MKYEKNCQLCVYVKDECVIDVFMANPEKKSDIKVDGDSVSTIYSSGKSVASILIAVMVDQGHLDY